MSTKISDQDQKWLDEINKLSEEGISIAKRSSMESAEYVDLLLSNFDDKKLLSNGNQSACGRSGHRTILCRRYCSFLFRYAKDITKEN